MCACARKPANSDKLIVMQSRSAPRARNVMTRDDDLHIRLGRIRSRGSRPRPFIALALAAAEKAGGLARPSRTARAGKFGRGQAASLSASRLTDRSRRVVVKARVVRHRASRAPLSAHLSYLRREGVTKDGASGRMFDAEGMTLTIAASQSGARPTGIISGSSYRRTTRPSCPTSKP